MRLRKKNAVAAGGQSNINSNMTPLSGIARQEGFSQSDFLVINTSSSQSIASFTMAAEKNNNSRDGGHSEKKVSEEIVLREEASHIRFELEKEMARIQHEMKELRRENAKLKEVGARS